MAFTGIETIEWEVPGTLTQMSLYEIIHVHLCALFTWIVKNTAMNDFTMNNLEIYGSYC